MSGKYRGKSWGKKAGKKLMKKTEKMSGKKLKQKYFVFLVFPSFLWKICLHNVWYFSSGTNLCQLHPFRTALWWVQEKSKELWLKYNPKPWNHILSDCCPSSISQPLWPPHTVNRCFQEIKGCHRTQESQDRMKQTILKIIFETLGKQIGFLSACNACQTGPILYSQLVPYDLFHMTTAKFCVE